jgi:uncharacterized surface protein with fasciclin (FAS1) repeats
MSRTRTHTRIAGVVAAGAVAAATALSAAPAHANTGTTSLAEVLAADGNRLDHRWSDFDIVEKAVYAVLDAKPDSAVAVLADGTTPLTAFVPTDRAFRRLVTSLTGDRKATERGVLRAVSDFADANTLEAVLLYHVVPGSTITYRQARQADGAKLSTALGSDLRVNVVGDEVLLRDADRNARNPRIHHNKTDLNKGNEQIAHGIGRVLRPLDL